jgi:hypothetical protein
MKPSALALLLTLTVVVGIAHDARSEPEPPRDHRKPPPVEVPDYPPAALAPPLSAWAMRSRRFSPRRLLRFYSAMRIRCPDLNETTKSSSPPSAST